MHVKLCRKGEPMTVWGGLNTVTEMPVQVEEVSPGIGRIVCLECEGNQVRYRSYFPPELGITQCVDCKGTGYVYVSV